MELQKFDEKTLVIPTEKEITEVEQLLKSSPKAAEAFVKKCAKGEISWEDFTPTERYILSNICVEGSFNDKTEIAALKALRDVDYIRVPPTPEEFVNDPKYLGDVAKQLYPKWKEELIYILDPKNEIYLHIVSGAIGSGKCTSKSFIFNDLGVLRIEELYEKRNDASSCLSESGLRKITNFHDEGETETKKITNYNGFTLECRPNHRIRVLENDNIIWKESKDIKEGDITIISRKNDVWGTNPTLKTVEEAEVFGSFIGDAYIGTQVIKQVFGPAEEDEQYRQYITKLLDKISIVYSNREFIRKDTNQKVKELYIHKKEQINYFVSNGIKGRSWQKTVPLCIRQGTKEVVAAFLRGLFDTDGSISEQKFTIEYSSCSEKLAEEVQILLLNFGINSRRKFKKNSKRGSWQLTILGRESKNLFAKEIGFSHPKKKARLKKHLSYKKTTWRHNDNEIIPVSYHEVEKVRSAIRGLGIGLKQNRGIFAVISSKEKQKFTYKALDKIVELFGEECLTPLLKKIYNERYIFSSIISVEDSYAHCYDLTVEGDPSYISSGYISHNTYVSIVAQLYKLAVLSCLRNIPAYFTLADTTKIYFALFTLSLGKAEAALVNDFKQIIGGSPYFKNIFPQKKNRNMRAILNTQGGQTSNELYEVVLPQGLSILLGSKVSHALSLAIVSAILDEVSVRQKRTVKTEDDPDSAEALFAEMHARMISRFNTLGYVPGLLSVVSSKKATSDFLEGLIAQKRNDPHTHISSFSQWDVKPNKYSKERFYVFVGTSKTSSRILTSEEVQLYPKDSPHILSVPADLRPSFEFDINSSLRDLAGIATSPQSLLFEDPILVSGAWDKTRSNPFVDSDIYVGVKDKMPIEGHLDRFALFEDLGFSIIPRHHPDMMRAIHLDLSKSGDSTGFCMGGVSAIKEYVSLNNLGQPTVKSYSPEIFIDFCVGIKAPQGDQVDYEKIQKFINYLRASGFNIQVVTFDQYQAVGPMQMLTKDNFNVQNVSTMRSNIPYTVMRDCIVNSNIAIPYNKVLERELVNLSVDFSTGREKIAKPRLNPDGSKSSDDQSDALASVVFDCVNFLIDTKKYPLTSNVGITGPVISGLYPEPANELMPNTVVYDKNIETKMMKEETERNSPYNFKY